MKQCATTTCTGAMMSLKYTRGTEPQLKWTGKSTKLPPRLIKVLKVLDGTKATCILDVGCGDGRFTKLLGNKLQAVRLHGIEMVGEGADKAWSRGIVVHEVDLNEVDFPILKESFDFAFAGEIIEHLTAPDELLSEIHRVLIPNGIVVLTVPNLSSWHCRLQLLLGYQPYAVPIITPHRWVGAMFAKRRSMGVCTKEHIDVNAKEGLDHVQFFTCKAICALLEAHGLEVEKVVGTTTDEFTVNLPLPIKALVKWGDKLIANIPSLASGVVIKARKVVQ